ncbi:hypothetical protein BLNAU_12457 [Blattamonas nauphoetae]|uniref:Uncharacterized protein n=1 Tax=Blattamonas nauphoetae TaxID=2049346 RepID=A0ABQ9XPA5_9EUKA|nr:hypothetical protein BLNAU_12457 [Blattamonas nauphoetae]
MEMFHYLIKGCSLRVNLALAKADMIPQLLKILNPLSLSFADCQNIHTCLMFAISISFWLATPTGLVALAIHAAYEPQTVHETVFQQVLAPSEKYICHLCMNRYSIIEGEQSAEFINFLAQLLRISPYYQPKMEYVLHIPIFLTIPSCLTFFENDQSIWNFLCHMNDAQRERNEKKAEKCDSCGR